MPRKIHIRRWCGVFSPPFSEGKRKAASLKLFRKHSQEIIFNKSQSSRLSPTLHHTTRGYRLLISCGTFRSASRRRELYYGKGGNSGHYKEESQALHQRITRNSLQEAYKNVSGCACSQRLKCRGRCLETIQMKMYVVKELEAVFLDEKDRGIKVL